MERSRSTPVRVETAAAAHIARRVEGAAREGLEPARVTLTEEGGELVATVELERPTDADRARGRRRVLVGPVPFRDASGLGLARAPRPHDVGHVTSASVAGRAIHDDGTGLSLAFVWCIDPSWCVPWGVHLHPLRGPALEAAPSVEVLRSQGVLVASQEIALPAGAGTLTLWHGRPSAPASCPVEGAAIADAIDRRIDPVVEDVASWVARHLHRVAATRAQIVVVRDGEILLDRALAVGGVEPDPTQAMRVGSVSKWVTALIAAGVARRLGLPRGLDTPIGELGVLRGGPPLLARATLAQLLDHTAGLVTSGDLTPDDPRHPLAEARVARDLGRAEGVARPGDLLRWFEETPDDAAFARAPGEGMPDYGNEGAILAGEILSRLVLGRDDGYEDLVARLLGACGVEVGDRGALLGAGLARSLARREAPPRSTAITWAPARFDPDRGVVATPHADNGPYLGGAAGLAVPLGWLARLLAAIGGGRGAARAVARADAWLPERSDLDALTTPSPRDARFGRGVMRGAPGYLPLRRAGASVVRPVRIQPLHHAGRVDGGSALLLHLLPIDPADGTGLAAVVAFDRLGPLDPHVEGAELGALLRPLGSAR